MEELSKDQLLGILSIILSVIFVLLSLDGRKIGNDNGSIKSIITALTAFFAGIYLLFFK